MKTVSDKVVEHSLPPATFSDRCVDYEPCHQTQRNNIYEKKHTKGLVKVTMSTYHCLFVYVASDLVTQNGRRQKSTTHNSHRQRSKNEDKKDVKANAHSAPMMSALPTKLAKIS